jgi:purine-binding chemotaxis protein CheW
MTTPVQGAEQTQYLTFRLAGEEYAIGILRVREIIEFGTLTTVPAAPPQLRGVINLRGSVVPVVDLALRFGLPATPITRRTCIIIVEAEVEADRITVGIIAESVNQVVDVLPEDILPPPDFGTHVPTEHLVGMGRTERKFLLILDLDRVLSPAEQAQLAAAEEALVDPLDEVHDGA